MVSEEIQEVSLTQSVDHDTSRGVELGSSMETKHPERLVEALPLAVFSLTPNNRAMTARVILPAPTSGDVEVDTDEEAAEEEHDEGDMNDGDLLANLPDDTEVCPPTELDP